MKWILNFFPSRITTNQEFTPSEEYDVLIWPWMGAWYFGEKSHGIVCSSFVYNYLCVYSWDLSRFVYFVRQEAETKHKHRSVDDYAVCDWVLRFVLCSLLHPSIPSFRPIFCCVSNVPRLFWICFKTLNRSVIQTHGITYRDLVTDKLPCFTQSVLVSSL